MNEPNQKKTNLLSRKFVPEILAPAGNKRAFLAALAADADAIYCGVKEFSARMAAKNFNIKELTSLSSLAHDRGKKVYITINSLLRPVDQNGVGNLIFSLKQHVKPDALIVQDLAVIELAKQAGYVGEIHLSTLANVSFASALKNMDSKIPIHRVVIPRELNIDEIKQLTSNCPNNIGLEVFVHGALCYGVSGRCYWSSYLGGRSGLRGRCVQPCRRRYTQKNQNQRFFSCQDYSLDVLVKTLRLNSKIHAWKIEGRKKGPHYVFYTVQAYRILRDLDKHGHDKNVAKKEALDLLAYALGRTRTNYKFLPQRPKNPINTNRQTGSGLYVGKILGNRKKPYIIPRENLLTGDLLRIGYEDEPWHCLKRVNKYVPKKGKLFLKILSKKMPKNGTAVFLIDRCERDLEKMMNQLEERLKSPSKKLIESNGFQIKLPKESKIQKKIINLHVHRKMGKKRKSGKTGYWLSPGIQKSWSRNFNPQTWWWLPPVIWPDNELEIKQTIDFVLKKGCRNFVLNSPWQRSLFSDDFNSMLWAGPFCNLANPLSINLLASIGFKGAIVSPELGREDYLRLAKHCQIPLGIVLSGIWPLCVSRTIAEDIKQNVFFASPRGEKAWVKKTDFDYWVFPNWEIDIKKNKSSLEKMGYVMFVHLIEPLPPGVDLKKRPGKWNWDLGLL